MSEYTYLGFNLTREPFTNPNVRLAISHAINRQELIDGVLQGFGQACSGPYSPLMPAYNPDIKPIAYNMRTAEMLLEEAGWKKGKDGIRVKNGKRLAFSLITNSGNPKREKVVVIVQRQLRKIGIDVKVQMIEWSSFLSNFVDKKNFDALVMGWRLSLDPDIFSIWHSSQTGSNQFNFISYANKEVDQLLEKGRRVLDEDKRVQIYRRVHELIAADQPVCFLFAPDSLGALHKRFRGLLETPTGLSWYWETRWYVPKSVQRQQ